MKTAQLDTHADGRTSVHDIDGMNGNTTAHADILAMAGNLRSR